MRFAAHLLMLMNFTAGFEGVFLLQNLFYNLFFLYSIKSFGEEHLETALSLENMALVHINLKQWDKAHYYFNRAGKLTLVILRASPRLE